MNFLLEFMRQFYNDNVHQVSLYVLSQLFDGLSIQTESQALRRSRSGISTSTFPPMNPHHQVQSRSALSAYRRADNTQRSNREREIPQGYTESPNPTPSSSPWTVHAWLSSSKSTQPNEYMSCVAPSRNAKHMQYTCCPIV